MDARTLSRAMGGAVSLARYEELAAPFTEAMKTAGCTTQRRAAMWCAQIGHESAGLQFFREQWPSDYEDRRDLGNTVPGDGKRFIGRGPIQLTGRGNYRAFGEWCHGRGMVPDPGTFTEHPEWVEEPRWGFLAAAWYWTVARPQLNTLADRADLKAATRAINGGLLGYDDRAARYQRCLQIPGLAGGGENMEKVLPYPRDNVRQETGYWCGPASAQTVILAATKQLVPERELAQKLKTTVNGTDDIRNIEPVLDEYTGVDYQKVYIPGTSATEQQIDTLWDHLTASIDAGYGIVANIVAPPGYYPEGVYGSVSPSYSGGRVYHYIALMGYRDGEDGRAAWVADSGFAPYGYWCKVRQLAHLIAEKGYSYAAVDAPKQKEEEMTQLTGVSAGALDEAKRGAIAAAADARKAVEILETGTPSLVNNRFKISPVNYLRLIDEAGWQNRVMLKAICRKLDLDPDQIITEATEKDRAK